MKNTFKFCKEQKVGQAAVYYTEQNDSYVNGSLSADRDEAINRFNSLCEGKLLVIKEILETREIPEKTV